MPPQRVECLFNAKGRQEVLRQAEEILRRHRPPEIEPPPPEARWNPVKVLNDGVRHTEH